MLKRKLSVKNSFIVVFMITSMISKATNYEPSSDHYISVNGSNTASDNSNYDNKGASGEKSIAIGMEAKATNTGTVAIGNKASATAEETTAVGRFAEASSTGATALGYGSVARGNYSVAVGRKADTRAENVVVIGYNAKANTNSKDSVVIGVDTSAIGYSAVAIGKAAKASNYGIAIGNAKAMKTSSFAIGDAAESLSEAAIAFGDSTKISEKSSSAIAVGNQASVTKSSQAIVIGPASNATNSANSIVMGTKAKATNAGNAVTLSGEVKSNETVAIGVRSIVGENANLSIAIGPEAYVGAETPNKPGVKPTETSQSDYRTRVVVEEVVSSPRDEVKYYFSTAIGNSAKAFGYQNTALGAGAEAYDTNTMALGFISKAKGHFSSAVGRQALTDGKYATALGYQSNGVAESALALGDFTLSNIKGSVALGSRSKTSVDKGVLGYDPSGEIASKDILLGANKSQYESLNNEIASLNSELTNLKSEYVEKNKEVKRLESELKMEKAKDNKDDAKISELEGKIKPLNESLIEKENAIDTKEKELKGKETKSNKLVSTWMSTSAAVSVGDESAGITRQITNVSAGSLDTDVVNVAQLKALASKLEDKSDKVAQDVEKNNINATIGIASAIAMANLPQLSGTDHRFSVSSSYGTYMGQHSLALGVSGTNDTGNVVYRASGSINSKGNLGFGIGISYQFYKMEKNKNTKSKVSEELTYLRTENEKLNKENNENRNAINALNEKVEMLMNYIKKMSK